MRRLRPVGTAVRSMAFRGASRICSRSKASRPHGARRPSRIESSISTHRRRTLARCGRRARRQTVHGPIRAGRRLVRRSTRNPWNPSQLEWIVGGPGRSHRRWARRLLDGTETLGSIISPSVTNGVTGLRPTYGRVSRHGAMALSLDDGQDWADVSDGRRLRAGVECDLRQRTARDDTCTDAPFEWNPDRPLAQCGSATSRESSRTPRTSNPTDAQKQTFDDASCDVRDALDAFRKLGAKLEPIAMPDFPTGSMGIV